ncbi:hypothetical protein HWV62_27164 [Athelia sp. TMB]|nr:hypothetical protein HWV62_27164 [Athelia sp. TMB]
MGAGAGGASGLRSPVLGDTIGPVSVLSGRAVPAENSNTSLSCGNVSQKELSRLAAVCKTLSEPALDVLWGTHWIDIKDLLDLIPAGLLLLNSSNKMVFSRKLKSQDLARFRYISHRVRKLQVPSVLANGRGRGMDAEGYFEALSRASNAFIKHQALLSKLQCLRWTHMPSSPLPYITLFLGSSMIHIEVDLQESTDPAMTVTLALIHSHSPNLQTLIMSGMPEDSGRQLLKALPAIISPFSGLRKLSACRRYSYGFEEEPSCYGINTADFLSALAHLPNLQKLSVCLFDTTPPEPSIVQLCVLEDLEELGLEVWSLQTAITFVDATRASSLQEISVTVESQPSMHTLKVFCVAMIKHCRTDILDSFDLSLVDEYAPESPSLDPKAIEPLLNFRCMRFFTLELHLSLEQICDSFFRQMINSWSSLEILKIPLEDSESPSKVTLDGIWAISSCPKLTCVHFPFNASASKRNLPRTATVCSWSLHTFWFGTSDISDPFALAGLLSEMFPNLRTIESPWSDDPSYYAENPKQRSWQELGLAYPWFVEFRKRVTATD